MDAWVQSSDSLGCRYGFRATDRFICMKDLALEIGQFDRVMVDDAYTT
jgi:hypothetical protein